MTEKVLKATHTGEFKIGNKVLNCAVLEDGTRVLTQERFLQAIGRSGKPAAGRGSSTQVEKVAPFLNAKNLSPFIDKELSDSTTPILFKGPKGSRAYGYRAELLPKVCEVYLTARDAGELLKSQENMGRACEVLIRGLAHVGIIALVDEATGYQEIRDKKALQAILDEYLLKEHAKWAKRFPDEFYKQMFRLRGWQWRGMSVNRPSVVGHYTKDLVYKRLATGVMNELERVNPKSPSGKRKVKHHQFLTPDIGHPALNQLIFALMGMMRASSTWDQFYRLVQRAYPKKGENLLLDFED